MEHTAPVRTYLANDGPHLRLKAHVKHAVSLVKHLWAEGERERHYTHTMVKRLSTPNTGIRRALPHTQVHKQRVP